MKVSTPFHRTDLIIKNVDICYSHTQLPLLFVVLPLETVAWPSIPEAISDNNKEQLLYLNLHGFFQLLTKLPWSLETVTMFAYHAMKAP